MESDFSTALAKGFIEDAAKAFMEQLKWVIHLFRLHPEYRSILDKEDMPMEKKMNLLDEMMKGKVDPQVYHLVLMSASTGNFHLLERIQNEVERIIEERDRTTRGIVESAFDLDDEMLSKLEKRFSDLMGNQVKLELRKNPDIIGGVVVTINDTVFDGSIRNRLLQMKRHILQE